MARLHNHFLVHVGPQTLGGHVQGPQRNSECHLHPALSPREQHEDSLGHEGVGFPAGSGRLTLDLHSAIHTLLKPSIYNKAIVCGAAILYSRQKAGHLKHVSLPA